MEDEHRVIYAIREAQFILAKYIEPGPRDVYKTLKSLLSLLDSNEVVESIDRLEVKYGLRFP